MNTPKKLQLKFTNAVHHLHGLICNCDEGITHSIQLLLQQTKPELTTNQLLQLQKCLGTTQEDGAGKEDDVDFGDDLERLFADDGTDPATG